MTKKIFAFIIALALILATSSVFAANELKDSMDKAGSSIQNVVDGAGTVVKDAGSAITDGARDLGNTVQNGAQNLSGTVENGARNVGGAVENGAKSVMDDMTRNDGYTATRTSNDGTIMGMSPNTWTWFILAIAALAIVGLVWYYAMQNKNEYHHNND